MTLEQLIIDALDLADEHTPTSGETIEQFRKRSAVYVIEALTSVAKIDRFDLAARIDPNGRLTIHEPRPGPMFG